MDTIIPKRGRDKMSYLSNYDDFTEQYSTEWDEYEVNLEDCGSIDIESLSYGYGGFDSLEGTLDLPQDYDNVIVSKRKLKEVFAESKGYNEEAVREAVQCVLGGGNKTLGILVGAVTVIPVDTLTDDIIKYLEA